MSKTALDELRARIETLQRQRNFGLEEVERAEQSARLHREQIADLDRLIDEYEAIIEREASRA